MSSTIFNLNLHSYTLSPSKNYSNFSNYTSYSSSTYRKFFNTENSSLHYSPQTLMTLESINPFDINYVERNKYLASLKHKPDFNSLLLSAKNISNFNNTLSTNVPKDEFKINDEKFKHRKKIRKNAESIVTKLLKDVYEKEKKINENNNNENNNNENINNENNNNNNNENNNNENNYFNNEKKIDMNEFTKKQKLFYSFRNTNTPSSEYSSYSTQIKCFGDLNNRNNFLIGSNFLLDNIKYNKLKFKNSPNKNIKKIIESELKLNEKKPIAFKFSLDKERKNRIYENYSTKMEKKKIQIQNFNNLNINEMIKKSNDLVQDLQNQIKNTKQDYLNKKITIKKFQDDILYIK